MFLHPYFATQPSYKKPGCAKKQILNYIFMIAGNFNKLSSHGACGHNNIEAKIVTLVVIRDDKVMAQ